MPIDLTVLSEISGFVVSYNKIDLRKLYWTHSLTTVIHTVPKTTLHAIVVAFIKIPNYRNGLITLVN